MKYINYNDLILVTRCQDGEAIRHIVDHKAFADLFYKETMLRISDLSESWKVAYSRTMNESLCTYNIKICKDKKTLMGYLNIKPKSPKEDDQVDTWQKLLEEDTKELDELIKVDVKDVNNSRLIEVGAC